MKSNRVVRELTLAGWMVTCSFWPALAVAADPATQRSSADPIWGELSDYVEGARVAFDVPGAAVAVIRNGEIEYVEAFGQRATHAPAQIDLQTRFMIGSVTKSMTTTLAAALVDQGEFEWDDAVVEHLPAFALSNSEWTPLVSLRDVFSHQSGVPRRDIQLYVDAPDPLGLIASVTAFPAMAPPGVVHEYQNQVFALGGLAAVRAAGAGRDDRALGRGYARLMRSHVFEPLEMDRTTLDFDAAIRDPNHALPHGYDAVAADVTRVPLGFERFATPIAPSGAVWSNIEDMARYFAMHLREGEGVDGEQLFPAAELAETHAPHGLVAPGLSYGLGWLLMDTELGTALGHDGGTAGFTARVLGLPELDWGVVVLSNRSGGSLLQEAVLRRAVQLSLGVPLPDDTDLLALEAETRAAYASLLSLTEPVTPALAAEYAGRYEHNLRVQHAGPYLTLRTNYGEHRFRALTGSPGAFLDVDNVLAGALLLFSSDAQGGDVLSLGIPTSDGQLTQAVVAARSAGPGHPHWGRPKIRNLSRLAELRRRCHLRQLD